MTAGLAEARDNGCGFECPYDGDEFDDIDGWLDHMESAHGINGPLT
jgi:hypothetical protein